MKKKLSVQKCDVGDKNQARRIWSVLIAGSRKITRNKTIRQQTIVILFLTAVFVLPELAGAQNNFVVGFKTYRKMDYSRPDKPKRDFEGKTLANFAPTELQISVWYPANKSKGAPLRFADYFYLTKRAARQGDASEADKKETAESVKNLLKAATGKDASETEIEAILNRTTTAFLDAPSAAGRFPVIISGFNQTRTGSTFAELLASRGYIVISVPTSPKTFTLQATKPQIAQETHIRNLEFLLAEAQQLPNSDFSRLGVVGINFDGLAALLFQMRTMAADAVVSLDGWEGKQFSVQTVQNSPYYDALKMRVPYLLFLQDEQPVPNPGLTLDYTVFDSLKYSERAVFVVNGLNHFYYIGNPAGMGIVPPEKQAGVKFVQQTVLDFLDAHVKKASSALTAAATPNLLRVEKREKALKAVPFDEELERIVMEEQDIAKLTRIFREARSENPALVLFKEDTINLFAFRFRRQNKPDIVLELLKLNAEAYPKSTLAAYNLGEEYRNRNQTELARQFFEKSLQSLSSDPNLSENRKNQMQKNLQEKLQALTK